MPPVTLTADGIAANNGCTDPSNAQDLPDDSWTSNTDATDWTCRWTMSDPDGKLDDTQTITVTVRKSDDLGDDTTVSVDLYESDVLVKTLVAATTLTDASFPGGTEVSGTFVPGDLSGDGTGVQVHVAATGVGTVLPRNVQVDGVVWSGSVMPDGRRPQSHLRRSNRWYGHPR